MIRMRFLLRIHCYSFQFSGTGGREARAGDCFHFATANLPGGRLVHRLRFVWGGDCQQCSRVPDRPPIFVPSFLTPNLAGGLRLCLSPGLQRVRDVRLDLRNLLGRLLLLPQDVHL